VSGCRGLRGWSKVIDITSSTDDAWTSVQTKAFRNGQVEVAEVAILSSLRGKRTCRPTSLKRQATNFKSSLCRHCKQVFVLPGGSSSSDVRTYLCSCCLPFARATHELDVIVGCRLQAVHGDLGRLAQQAIFANTCDSLAVKQCYSQCTDISYGY